MLFRFQHSCFYSLTSTEYRWNVSCDRVNQPQTRAKENGIANYTLNVLKREVNGKNNASENSGMKDKIRLKNPKER